MNPATIPDLGNKLKLVTSKEFMGLKLYNDKMCNPERCNRKTIFNLWLHCCRKSNAVTLNQMIAFQPHAEQWLRIYDRYVDAEGRTTLNMEEYMVYRAETAKLAE